MSLLDHKQLMIVKGVGPTPGDTASAEQPLVTIDLMSAAQGYSLVDWSPNIPSMKNSAVWADSPLTDGRVLLSGANSNVIEKITIQLSVGDCQLFAAKFSDLQQIAQDARDFWSTFYQIEPVYLQWWSNGAPGPQYALIFNIDMDVKYQDSSGICQAEITLSIEREVGWAGIHPGGNPKEWTCYTNGVSWDATKASLRSGINHLVNGTVNNKQEFNGIFTFLTQNFIDIPAAKLPGDLPPLLCAVIIPSSGGAGTSENIMLAKTAKPLTLPDREGNTALPRYNSFAGAAGSLGTDATFVADATLGIKHTPVSATARYVSVSFATPTDQLRITWAASTTFGHLNPHILRGRYRVLLRGEQNAGAFGNTTVHLNIYNGSGYFFISPTINPKVTVANTVQLNDLGVVTFPPSTNSYSAIDGKGALLADRYSAAGTMDGNLTFELYAARSTGAATLRVYDVILIPIDEGAIYIAPIQQSTGGNEAIVYDTSRYFTHGKPEIYAAVRLDDGSNGLDNEVIAEPRGALELTPGATNRLYILGDHISAPIGSNTADTFSVFINIVPRWAGIRDA